MNHTSLKVVDNTFLLCFHLVATNVLKKHEAMFLLEFY